MEVENGGFRNIGFVRTLDELHRENARCLDGLDEPHRKTTVRKSIRK